MKATATAFAAMLACTTAAFFLATSDQASAQSMKTRNISGKVGTCALTLLPRSDKPAQGVTLVIDAKVWWVGNPNSNPNPKVGYQISLGLTNPIGFPTWTPRVEFKLTDVRPNWYPNETPASPLSGAASSPHTPWKSPAQTIVMPNQAIAAGTTVMAASNVSQVVDWKHRPQWWITAKDIQSDQFLGSCAIEEMEAIANPVLSGGASAEVKAQALKDPQPDGASSAPARPRPSPNWDALKSSQ